MNQQALIDEYKQALSIIEALESKLKYERISSFYPDKGPLRRELYSKHLEHFRAGHSHRERLFMAGNRSGKTICGAFETALHLTGQYDKYAPWWEGRRFDHPVDAWAASTTNESTRDIVQLTLLGQPNEIGSGMIPRDSIAASPKSKQGVPDGIESVRVNHISGGVSYLGFKSYKQKRESFQGTGKHVIWLDEEGPIDIYNECVMRTGTTDGVVYTTFTPLLGLSEMVLSFLPDYSPNSNLI